MASIAINVIDANHISLVLTARAPVAVTLDRGVSGVGIASISGTTISGSYYLVVTYTNGTTQNVGPFALTGTVAAGANTQIQYNSSGALAGSANLTWSGSALGVGGTITSQIATNTTNELSIRTPDATFNSAYLSFGTATYNRAQIFASGSSANTGQLNFNTYNAGSGAVQMVITAGGNVGIGSTTPQTKLDVYGSNAITRFQGSSTSLATYATFYNNGANTTYFGIESNTGTGIIGSGSAYATVLSTVSTQPLIFGTNGAEKMRIDGNGNVGIGTISPATSTLTLSGKNLYLATSGNFVMWDTGGQYGFNSDSATRLSFFSGSSTERMRLDASGNLGLGVTPSAWNTYKVLQVGNAATASLTTGNNSAWTSNAYFASGWSYVGTSTATQYAQLNGAHQWYSAPSGTAGTAITFTQAMVLNASGNLGLATTTSSARFAVASTTSTGVATSAWSNAYSIFGPNVGSTSGAALALGYNTSTDASEILSLAPGLAWKPMNVLTAGVQFNAQAGSEAMRITSNDAGAGTISMALRLAANNTSADNSIVAIGFGVQNDGFSKGGIGWLRGTGGSDTGNLTFYNNGTNDASNISTSNETMRIDTNKNLLIGLTTTAATTVKLQVSTDALINGLTIGRGGASLNASTAIGIAALPVNTTGQYNAAIGYRTLYLNTTGGFNTATGAQSLRTNLSGTDNVATGYSSLYLNSSGNNNSAFGSQALYNNTASNNTAVGYQAGYATTTASGVGVTFVGSNAGAANTTGYNDAFGIDALKTVITGNSNAAFGYSSLKLTTSNGNSGFGFNTLGVNTTGNSNVAIGASALQANTTASSNTAVGYQAAYSNTTGTNSTAFGAQALYSNTTGADNVAVGPTSLIANTTGTQNSALGVSSLYSNTTGSSNTAIGLYALYRNVTGANSTAVGFQSLFSNTANNNTGLGWKAGYAITSGIQNTAVGHAALTATIGGSTNTALGFIALTANTSGSSNTAVGNEALQANTTASNNTAVGYQAGYANTTGTSLVYIGYQAGKASTTADNNTAVGDRSLQNTTTGASNTSLGGLTLQTNTTGGSNTALGYWALFSNTTANNNTSTGFFSMRLNTTGADNTANGTFALEKNTTGSSNTAIGREALQANTTASNNTAVGYQAGYANTTGSVTAFGNKALQANTTGGSNTAVGSEALFSNTTAEDNTAVGTNALRSTTTGSYNSAFGKTTLYSNTTGQQNVGLGREALYTNTTGSFNVTVGMGSGYYNTTGGNNTALGHNALYNNTTASNNTAVGFQAGYGNTTGTRNTFVGTSAGAGFTTGSYNAAFGSFAMQATTSTNNTAIGDYALQQLTTGGYNTALGNGSGYLITSGSKNTIVGLYNGNQGGLDIRTANNYIVLSDGDGNVRGHFNSGGSFLVGTTNIDPIASRTNGFVWVNSGASSQTLRIRGLSSGASNICLDSTSGTNIQFWTDNGTTYVSAGTITSNGSATLYNATSDYRLKNVIGAVTGFGERIDALKPIKYQWKDNGLQSSGFLAHEFQSVYADSVTGTKDAIDSEGKPKYQAMQAGSAEVIADLVAEIQDLRKRLAVAGI